MRSVILITYLLMGSAAFAVDHFCEAQIDIKTSEGESKTIPVNKIIS